MPDVLEKRLEGSFQKLSESEVFIEEKSNSKRGEFSWNAWLSMSTRGRKR